MPKTLIIGGGLLGLASAKALSDRGWEVEVLEAREDVGLEASYANGGLLTPSMSDPWNAPGVHKHLAASLFDQSSSMKLHVSAIPSLLSWGLGFLRHSSRQRHSEAVLSNYRLASYSVERTDEWRRELELKYQADSVGSLKVFRDRAAMAGSLELAESLRPLGLRLLVLNAEQTLETEPQLHAIRDQIVGSLHFPDDQSGDAYLFCRALKVKLEEAGVRVRTGMFVSGLRVEKERLVGLRTAGGDLKADSVVVASGVQTPALLKGSGISLPIAPAKGYSVTFSTEGQQLPRVPIIDDAMHAGITPLGNRLRAVGTAEFAGYDTRLHRVRIDNLVRLLKELYPQIAAEIDLEKAEAWAGLRPMSSDGKPFIGTSRIEGLYFNTGHGHLGWTKAAGSACLLADLMANRRPAIDEAPFRVHR